MFAPPEVKLFQRPDLVNPAASVLSSLMSF